MSQFYEEDVFNQMEADGTADWIREIVGDPEAPAGEDTPATADAPEEDTVEADEEVEGSEEEEVPADAEIAAEAESDTTEADEEDDTLYLDLDPETEALLNEKYGGDLGKALSALRESQSLIGRQGNELGDVRKELQQLRAEFAAGMTRSQLVWPDEDAEPEEAVGQYRQIADAAFESQDAETFGQAMTAWQEIDPLGSEAWATMKATQVMISQAREGGTPEPESLEKGVEALKVTYPQLSNADFQMEVNKELERFPTLQRTFQDTTASPSERIAALEEAARLVASRQADGDVRQAVRRVAVKQSEEARKSRAEARVATGGGRGKPTEPADRQIAVGDTGHTVGEKELQERIKELTGMDVQVGGSTWKSGSKG
ncbi:MAG: hypothetical protein OEV29_12410 [Thermoleophilia bacterium]|nr:hypothetical protein [Thermoleophilia bacterium]